MFIDCAKLEKILKTDYKTWGVKFGLTKKGMQILNGTGWIIEADNTRITKEFLGTVIKTCGLAPEKGEFMTYQKGHDPQFETERKPLLWDMAEDTKEALISPIKIMQNDNMMTVVKTPGGARLINDARLAMVNPDKCRDDENPPSTFAVHGDWLVSCNDEMAVGICFTSPVYKPELEVLRLLSGVDFYWIETPHYELQVETPAKAKETWHANYLYHEKLICKPFIHKGALTQLPLPRRIII